MESDECGTQDHACKGTGLCGGRIKSQAEEIAHAKAIAELDNIFTYHRPIGNQPQRYEALRAQAKELARTVLELCPPSRERSLAITAIQQSTMWANAAIAINEEE